MLFEKFVVEPMPYLEKIAAALDSKITVTTRNMMRKQNVPRKLSSEGIFLELYRRNGWEPPKKDSSAYQGKSAMGAIRFKPVTLAAGKKIQFVLLLGICQNEAEIENWIKKYGTWQKAEAALKNNKASWGWIWA